jgi:hypothetical protein
MVAYFSSLLYWTPKPLAIGRIFPSLFMPLWRVLVQTFHFKLHPHIELTNTCSPLAFSFFCLQVKRDSLCGLRYELGHQHWHNSAECMDFGLPAQDLVYVTCSYWC